jgi:hypothetical protein
MGGEGQRVTSSQPPRRFMRRSRLQALTADQRTGILRWNYRPICWADLLGQIAWPAD